MKKKQPKRNDLPLSYEERLRQECPALFEWNSSIEESIFDQDDDDYDDGHGNVEAKSAEYSRMPPPQDQSYIDDDDEASQWLQQNTPNFASAEKGGYMYPSHTPAVNVSNGLGSRMGKSGGMDRNAMMSQITQKLQGLDPAALQALLRQLG
jgi:hypothetical protein